MTAAQAREKTQAAMSDSNPAFKGAYASVMSAIGKAADGGQSAVSTTFDGVPFHMQNAMVSRLAADGFKVTPYHADQRDPRERDYWTVSW